jgi:hypothetical protein
MHWNIIYSYKLQGICLFFVRILIDWKFIIIRSTLKIFLPYRCLCFVYVRNNQVKIILLNFKSKFVKTRIIIDRKPAIAEERSCFQQQTIIKIAIYCQQILTFVGLISSFHHYCHLNVSHRTFLHHSSLCSHANVHFLKFLTLLCTKTLLK